MDVHPDDTRCVLLVQLSVGTPSFSCSDRCLSSLYRVRSAAERSVQCALLETDLQVGLGGDVAQRRPAGPVAPRAGPVAAARPSGTAIADRRPACMASRRAAASSSVPARQLQRHLGRSDGPAVRAGGHRKRLLLPSQAYFQVGNRLVLAHLARLYAT